MAQTYSEIAKEIIIAAIQSGHIIKDSVGMSNTVEEINVINANEIAKFYKTVYNAVKAADS
ncbi:MULTISPECIES: hypothetical protein [Paenibacillus]|uniref:Uncharacterized protein n=1 Tax=Paenibacillus odorifer TaxID=189426 RepID=A0ABX3HX55_9BACL|nr:hypothetical protein [Paenibacillus odorifer]OMD55255.1 hypothetical protein BSK51_04170 [Paenibacillus odorifer]